MEEPILKLNGYIPEPVLEKHWSFEEHFYPFLQRRNAPESVDLRPYSSPRHNQRQTESCVAQSVVKALEISRNIQNGVATHTDLSVMAVYYLAREIQFPPVTNIDAGSIISCACDAVRRFGVPPESEWPFDVSKINMPPSWAAMRHAFTNKIDTFYRIKSTGQTRVDMVADAIRSNYPVIYGSIIGSNWLKYKAGQILTVTPDKDEVGRHATVLLGTQDGNFIGENSWGASFGDNGFYLASPDLIASDKAGDFWVLGR